MSHFDERSAISDIRSLVHQRYCHANDGLAWEYVGYGYPFPCAAALLHDGSVSISWRTSEETG
jgi:hypothetical protein